MYSNRRAVTSRDMSSFRLFSHAICILSLPFTRFQLCWSSSSSPAPWCSSFLIGFLNIRFIFQTFSLTFSSYVYSMVIWLVSKPRHCHRCIATDTVTFTLLRSTIPISNFSVGSSRFLNRRHKCSGGVCMCNVCSWKGHRLMPVMGYLYAFFIHTFGKRWI